MLSGRDNYLRAFCIYLGDTYYEFIHPSAILRSLLLISLESKHSGDISEVLTVGTRPGLFGIKTKYVFHQKFKCPF